MQILRDIKTSAGEIASAAEGKKWHLLENKLSEKQNKKESKGLELETELRHHTHTLCPTPFAVLVLALAEVVLSAHLDTGGDVPEEVEGTIQPVSVLGRLCGVVGQVA